MKKILISAVACLSISQASMFVGVDGGYTMYGTVGNGATNSTIYDENYKQRFDNDWWSLGLNFGAEGFVNNYFGARAFLEAIYSNSLDNTKHHSIDIAGNADLMLNFLNTGGFSLGVFGGLGVGYSILFGNNSNQGYIPLYGRTGITMGLGSSARIDLTLKLPITSWEIHNNEGVDRYHAPSPFAFQAGFKYLF